MLRKADEARAPAAMERLIKVAAPRRSAIKSPRNSDFLSPSFSQIPVANAKKQLGWGSGSQFPRKSQLSSWQKAHGGKADSEKVHCGKLDGEEPDGGAACCLSSPYVT